MFNSVIYIYIGRVLKCFFTRKYIKIILYNFLKIIFDILKRPNNKKKIKI
jgi:hypothetical protein